MKIKAWTRSIKDVYRFGLLLCDCRECAKVSGFLESQKQMNYRGKNNRDF